MKRFVVERLLGSADPAVRRLAGDQSAGVMSSPRVQILMEFPLETHPYKKWWGTHWRLVALADLGVPPGTPAVEPGMERELSWLLSTAHRKSGRRIDGLMRRPRVLALRHPAGAAPPRCG